MSSFSISKEYFLSSRCCTAPDALHVKTGYKKEPVFQNDSMILSVFLIHFIVMILNVRSSSDEGFSAEVINCAKKGISYASMYTTFLILRSMIYSAVW